MSNQDSSSNFGTPYQKLLDHCKSVGLHFQSDDDNKCLSFSIGSKVATYDVILFITENDALLQVYVYIPVAVGEEALRPLVTEFVARANYRLAIGCFNLNVDEGRLSFHTSHAIVNGLLDDGVISLLLGAAFGTADRYFPALARVIFGGMTPSDAVYLSELDYHIAAEEPKADKMASENSSAPKKSAAPQKKRRSRKNPQSESSKYLPGLFDTPSKDDEKGDKTPPDPQA